jgi:hypothetical protein
MDRYMDSYKVGFLIGSLARDSINRLLAPRWRGSHHLSSC